MLPSFCMRILPTFPLIQYLLTVSEPLDKSIHDDIKKYRNIDIYVFIYVSCLYD